MRTGIFSLVLLLAAPVALLDWDNEARNAPGVVVHAQVLPLLSLNRTRTLDVEPAFLWKELEPGQKYGLELRDGTGRVVYETGSPRHRCSFPPAFGSSRGRRIRGEVSACLSDGRKYSSTAEFALAAAEVRAVAESLRPATSAPLSTRIAYAAWLDQMDLKDEARKYWKAASAERPEGHAPPIAVGALNASGGLAQQCTVAAPRCWRREINRLRPSIMSPRG